MREKGRICPDCEALVPLSERKCHYCGATVEEKSLCSSKDPLGESLASLYKPPYMAPSSVRISDSALERAELPPETEEKAERAYAGVSWLDSAMVPLILLLVGAQGFLFSLFYLLFGKEGRLILVWEASSLKLFSLLALPALFFGVKLWKRLQD